MDLLDEVMLLLALKMATTIVLICTMYKCLWWWFGKDVESGRGTFCDLFLTFVTFCGKSFRDCFIQISLMNHQRWWFCEDVESGRGTFCDQSEKVTHATAAAAQLFTLPVQLPCISHCICQCILLHNFSLYQFSWTVDALYFIVIGNVCCCTTVHFTSSAEL